MGSRGQVKVGTRGRVIAFALALLLVAASASMVMPLGTAGRARAAGDDLSEFLSSPGAVNGDGTHHLGWRRSPPGEYRMTPTAPKLRTAMALGASADLSSQLPPVGDQGNQGSCVGWATSYYYKTWSEKQEHSGWSLADNQHRFSPSFMYNQINGGSDNGANFQDAFNLLQSKGNVDIAEMPYNQGNWTTQPTSAQLEAAKPYRIPSGWTNFWLRYTDGPFNPPNSIDNAKAWLDSGKMLVMGIPVYYDFPGFGGSPARAYYDYNGSSSMAGGHAVCICGYDDNINPGGADADRRGGFKMVNSWGAGWNGASAGFVYLSYDFVKRYVWEAWTMGDNAPDSPSISHLSASSGQAGQAIEIDGGNFGAMRRAAGVSFNGTGATQVTFTNEKVTAVIPTGAATGPLVVRDWEGTASNSVNFTVVSGGSAATVSSVSPNTGADDGMVALSVTGSNFASGCQVRLTGDGVPEIEATGENRVSAGQVDCTVDLTGAEPGARDIIVANPDTQYGVLPGGFTVTAAGSDSYEPNDTMGAAYGPLAPGVAYSSFIFSEGDVDYFSLNVPEGCARLTATLESLPAGCDYDLYLYDASGDEMAGSYNGSNADEALELESPAPGVYYLQVTPYDGYSRTDPYALGFSLVQAPPRPAIERLSPGGGSRQTPVTIYGSNFGTARGASRVTFGSVAAGSSDYLSWENARVVVRVPGGAGGKPAVKVTTGAGTSNGVAFSVIPQISTINPTRGRAGTLVSIYGQGFGTWSSGHTCVYFGSQRAISYACWSNGRISVRVPTKATGTVRLKVKTAGGTSAGKPFTVY